MRPNFEGKKPGRRQKPALTAAAVEGISTLLAETPATFARDWPRKAALNYLLKLVDYCQSDEYLDKRRAATDCVRKHRAKNENT